MVQLGKLGSLVKKATLVIIGIEEENTTNTQVLRIELGEEVTATGSIPLSDGTNPKRTDKFVFIGQPNDQNEGAISKFMAELPADFEDQLAKGDGVKVETTLKMDVAKPKVRNGKVVKGPQIWLTEARFANGAATLINSTRESNNNTILKLFGRPVATTNAPAAENVAAEVTADGGKI